MIKRIVTNVGDPLVDGLGTLLSGVRITFQLVNEAGAPSAAWDAVSGERIVPGPVEVLTDENGEFSAALWPTSRGDRILYWLCRVDVPDVEDFLAPLIDGEGSVQWIAFQAQGSAPTPQQYAMWVQVTNGVSSKAALDAVAGAYSDGNCLNVTNDPTPANNGTWRKEGAGWVQGSFDRVALVETRATNLEGATKDLELTGDEFTGSSTREGDIAQLQDAMQRILWAVTTDGTFLAKLGISVGVSNGLTIARQADGTYKVSLGTAEGIVQIGGSTVDTVTHDNPNVLHSWLDENKRVLAHISRKGAFHVGGAAIDATYDNPNVLYYLLDENKRVLASIGKDGTLYGKFVSSSDSTEIVAARGTQPTLNDRLSQTLRPDGLDNGYIFGEEHLRQTRRLLQALKRGVANTQFPIVALGDSWTDTSTYWSRYVAEEMRASHGDAGAGYFGLRITNANTWSQAVTDASLVAATSTGTWTPDSFNQTAAHISQSTSTVAGSRITMVTSADSVNIIFPGGTGTVQYRYNGGAWTPLALSGSGFQNVALAAPPVGSFTLDVEVVSGTVTIYGFDFRKTANGIRWNKIGQSSTRLSQWVAVDAAAWQASVAVFNAKLITIMFGTNDKYYYDATTFKGHYQTMIDRCRAAAPSADILLISPPDGLSGPQTATMAQLADVTRALAATNKVAHMDLQPLFGPVPASNYGEGTGFDYFLNADTNHPAETGRQLIAESVLRVLHR